MKTSWKRCIEFSNMAQSYLARSKGNESKLSYAINRIISRLQKEQARVSEALSDIEIDYCLTEKRGENEVISRDAQGNLQYTKEALKERNKKQREYLNSDDIEIDPHFATSLPSDLNEAEIEAFSGFVISAEEAERLMRECEARADQAAEPAKNGHQSAAVAAVGV